MHTSPQTLELLYFHSLHGQQKTLRKCVTALVSVCVRARTSVDITPRTAVCITFSLFQEFALFQTVRLPV